MAQHRDELERSRAYDAAVRKQMGDPPLKKKPRKSTKVWRTERVYVDVAVCGPITNKQIVRDVQDALDKHIQLTTRPDVQYGRRTAKDKRRVDPPEDRNANRRWDK